MIALARFILKGPSQAALVMTTSAVLATIFLPVSWFSGGALALITLSKGDREAFQALSIACLATGIITWFATGSSVFMLAILLILWLPVWVVAYALRQTRSLAIGLQLVTALGFGAMIIVHFTVPGLSESIRQVLQEAFANFAQTSQGQIDPAQFGPYIELFAKAGPGLIVSTLLFNVVFGLIIGRWWQANLFNPGGLSKEFNQLRFGKTFAILVVLLVAAKLLTDSQLIYGLVIVVVSVYMVQGLALVHGVVETMSLHRFWLAGLYVLMIIVPQVSVLLVIAGIVDAWLDFRLRLTAKFSG